MMVWLDDGDGAAPSLANANDILDELAQKSADDILDELAQKSPALRQFVEERLARNRPAVAQRHVVRKRRVPAALTMSGRAGQTLDVHAQRVRTFRPVDLFATDDSRTPGRGTRVTLHVGQCVQFEDVPTWMFAEWMNDDELKICEDAAKLLGTSEETPSVREAARRVRMVQMVRSLTWATWGAALPVRFRVTFDTTCTWQAVVWGDEVA